MDNPNLALEAYLRQAQSSLWMFWVLWLIIVVVNMMALLYFGYWMVQLIKAAIRAIDRWNTTPPKRMDVASAKTQTPSALVDELKYAPKH